MCFSHFILYDLGDNYVLENIMSYLILLKSAYKEQEL